MAHTGEELMAEESEETIKKEFAMAALSKAILGYADQSSSTRGL